jgi:anti-sigma B factor antagonist
MATQTLSVIVEQDHAVITVSGEHEAYSADKLAKQLSALIAEDVGLTIDLRQATFIDSTVVGVLIAAHRRATDSRLPFRLLVGGETGWPVRRMIEITGLAERLEIIE